MIWVAIAALPLLAPDQAILLMPDNKESSASMIGTTRSLVSYFMKFRKLGPDQLQRAHRSQQCLLDAVLRDKPELKSDEQGRCVAIKTIFRSVAFGYLEYLSARQRSTQTVSPRRGWGYALVDQRAAGNCQMTGLGFARRPSASRSGFILR
jgi:hypothetical protein